MMTPEQIRENIFAMKFMQAVYSESPEFSAHAFSCSLENNLYDRIVNSLAWSCNIPFMICMTSSSSIKKIPSGKKRVRPYYLPDDEKFKRAVEVIHKSEENANYTEKHAGDIFDVAMEDIAKRLPTKGLTSVDYNFSSEVNFRLWEVTQELEELFIKLTEDAWDISGRLLTEIAVTIDVTQYRREIDSYFGLYNLPADIAEGYIHGFSEMVPQNMRILESLPEVVEQVKQISQEFPIEYSSRYIDGCVEQLEQIHIVTKEFNTKLSNDPKGEVKIYDCSLDGFLNNPLPPL